MTFSYLDDPIRIERSNNRFVVRWRRAEVVVRLDGYGIKVITPESRDLLLPRSAERRPYEFDMRRFTLYFGLFEGRVIIQQIAHDLIAQATPVLDIGRKPNYDVRWFRGMEKALRCLIPEERQRLVAMVPEQILAIQRAVFAACFGWHYELHRPDFYTQFPDQFLQDVIKYPAAAIAFLIHAKHRDGILGIPDRHQRDVLMRQEAVVEHEYQTLCKDWKAIYSDTGSAYGSLNRTLMNLPRGVGHDLIWLDTFHLTRPLTNRTELLISLHNAELDYRRDWETPNLDLIYNARAPEIRAAFLAWIDDGIDPTWARRRKRVKRLVMRARESRQLVSDLLWDYPEAYHGDLHGLAVRSIEWHRNVNAREVEIERRTIPDETPMPAIEVPDDSGITYLATAGDIRAEGDAMRHCVASYVKRAMRGQVWLFHVANGDGKGTTVEVSPVTRAVVASRGFANEENATTRAAASKLQDWLNLIPL